MAERYTVRNDSHDWWDVYQRVPDGHIRIAECYTKADAERIARALALLDQQERGGDDPAACPFGNVRDCCRHHETCKRLADPAGPEEG